MDSPAGARPWWFADRQTGHWRARSLMAMIRNGQVHNIGAHDMQAQTAFVASVFHVAASIADFRHPARPTLSFATDPIGRRSWR